jgi:hypothetical protein
MTRRLIASAVLLLLAGPAVPAASSFPRVAPEEVGLSSERLGRLARTIEDEIAKGNTPGAVVLIARRGKIAYFQSFGFADKAKGVAASAKQQSAATKGLADETDDAAAATKEYTRALNGWSVLADSLAGKQRTARDAELALKSAQLDVRDALKSKAEALKESGRKSDEYKQACIRVAEAELRAKDAAYDYRKAQKDAAAASKGSVPAIDSAASAYNRLAANAAKAVAAIRRGVEGGYISPQMAANYRKTMAAGDIFPATPRGVPVTVAEAGYPEAVIPLNSTPRSISLLAQAARAILGSSPQVASTPRVVIPITGLEMNPDRIRIAAKESIMAAFGGGRYLTVGG